MHPGTVSKGNNFRQLIRSIINYINHIMAATLDTIRSWNSSLPSKYSSLNAVFVGATSGIGLETLKQFATHIPTPKAYIVGRSQAKSQPLLDELKQINSNGKYIFIEAEISQLKNVDDVCAKITAQEDQINLLVMSPGYISFRGREPTPDGLDTSMALRYYGRVRFMQHLLPVMKAPLGRVLNILAGGQEAEINTNDLALKDEKNYGIGPASVHSATMLTLAMHKFAREHRNISFVHTFPGMVMTPVFQRGMNPTFKFFMRWAVLPILHLVAMTQERSGEWHLYYATSDKFPAAAAIDDNSELLEGVVGDRGSGMYIVEAQKGKMGDGTVTRDLQRKGVSEVVWRHTEEVFASMQK